MAGERYMRQASGIHGRDTWQAKGTFSTRSASAGPQSNASNSKFSGFVAVAGREATLFFHLAHVDKGQGQWRFEVSC
jgi:hypothetical protein